MTRVAAAALLFAFAACATGEESPLLDARLVDSGVGVAFDGASPARDGAADDASVSDASSDARAPDDAAGKDAGADAETETETDASDRLDPELKRPETGSACSSPGNIFECSSLAVCRIDGVNSGRCESCSPCGNLGAACTASDQCDTLFQCFRGKCTAICPLGTVFCGPVADCIDVGHATHGVCRP